MRIAKTDVDDQTSAMTIAKKASVAIDQPGNRRLGDAERLQRVVDQPDIVVEQELELEADEDRREHHRKHHQRAQEALAARRPLDQQREAEAEQHFEIERDRQQEDRAAEGLPEHRVGEGVDVVAQADEAPRASRAGSGGTA